MPSLLQGQIDFLDEQLGSLNQHNDHALAEVEEAIELLLLLYHQIRTAENRANADLALIIPLYEHWLRGVDLIIPLIRALKTEGHILIKAPELMRACIHGRGLSVIASQGESGRGVALEEVQRELQGRA